MSVIHLNIGSNLGDRAALIERAVCLVREAFASSMVTVSALVESEPWGFASDNTFLNCGVMITTPRAVDPAEVLAATQAIERQIASASNYSPQQAAHRNADGTYRDRPIDIDIITIDRLRADNPELVLPHPRAARRRFVMAPLEELDSATAAWIISL